MGNFEKPKADNTNAERWSEEEENRLLELAEQLGEDAITKRKEGDDGSTLTLREIAEEFNDRSYDAVKNKLRKLRKREGIYNFPYQDEKYEVNEKWIQYIVERFDGNVRAFDGYAGTGGSANIYFDYVDVLHCCEVEKNEFQKLIKSLKDGRSTKYQSAGQTPTGNREVVLQVNETDIRCYNENVNNVLHRQVGNQSSSYQFIDIDPCGSPFVSIPQSLRLLSDGFLAVTYGDLQLHRWGRDAPLTKAYRMPDVESFDEVLEYMIAWTMFEGVRQEASDKTRKVSVQDLKILPKKQNGVARVLYKVEKKRALAPVLNFLEDVFREFEAGSSPARARYDLDQAKNSEL